MAPEEATGTVGTLPGSPFRGRAELGDEVLGAGAPGGLKQVGDGGRVAEGTRQKPAA